MILKRFFDPKAFDKLKSEFSFLIEIVNQAESPFKITLGNNNFALFCYGISIGKVELSIFGGFEVMIPKVFFPQEILKENSFNFRQSTHGYFAELDSTQIKNFLCPELLEKFAVAIKPHLEKPELDFAYQVRKANHGQEKFIFVDRMITDGELKGKRMDSIALAKEGNEYSIHICEFRLAENENLKDLLPRQLEGFVSNVQRYLEDYRTNYINNYQQQKSLGLLPPHFPDNIQINRHVKGHIFIPENSQGPESLSKNFPKLIVSSVDKNYNF